MVWDAAVDRECRALVETLVAESTRDERRDARVAAWRALLVKIAGPVEAWAKGNRVLRRCRLTGDDDARAVLVAVLERLAARDYANLRRFAERRDPEHDTADEIVTAVVRLNRLDEDVDGEAGDAPAQGAGLHAASRTNAPAHGGAPNAGSSNAGSADAGWPNAGSSNASANAGSADAWSPNASPNAGSSKASANAGSSKASSNAGSANASANVGAPNAGSANASPSAGAPNAGSSHASPNAGSENAASSNAGSPNAASANAASPTAASSNAGSPDAASPGATSPELSPAPGGVTTAGSPDVATRDGDTPFRAWLLRLVEFVARDHVRERLGWGSGDASKRDLHSDAAPLSAVPERGTRPPMTDRLTVAKIVAEMQDHIATFPADMKAALELWLDDVPLADIATRLSLEDAHRARALVRAGQARLRDKFRGRSTMVFA